MWLEGSGKIPATEITGPWMVGGLSGWHPSCSARSGCVTWAHQLWDGARTVSWPERAPCQQPLQCLQPWNIHKCLFWSARYRAFFGFEVLGNALSSIERYAANLYSLYVYSLHWAKERHAHTDHTHINHWFIHSTRTSSSHHDQITLTIPEIKAEDSKGLCCRHARLPVWNHTYEMIC